MKNPEEKKMRKVKNSKNKKINDVNKIIQKYDLIFTSNI